MHRHGFRGFVVAAELVRQAGVGMGADMHIGHARKLFHVLAQLVCAQGAVEAYAQGPRMHQGIPERLGGLAGKSAAAGIGNGAGNHNGHAYAVVLEILIDGEQGGLAVKGIEYRLHQ